MDACVPCFGGYGHGSGCEILHLLELEVKVLGYHGKFCHVLGCASGMGTDEVGDELLTEIVAMVDVVKDEFEVVEELEGGLAHEVEHTVGGVFGSDFEATADMAGDEFFGIFSVDAVDVFVACVV